MKRIAGFVQSKLADRCRAAAGTHLRAWSEVRVAKLRLALTVLSIDSQMRAGCFALMLLAGALSVGSGDVLAQAAPSPLVQLDFNRSSQGELPEGTVIKTQFKAPDVVKGVEGSAWRTDGFSSLAEIKVRLDAQSGFAMSLWVALESFPSDLEVPVDGLTPSSIAQQARGDEGFDLHIDTFGRWGLRVATTAGTLEAAATDRFPLRRWVHLVANVDPVAGTVDLYQDGERVASAAGKPGIALRLAQVPLTLASPPKLATILNFRINRLNAAFDLVSVYGHPLTSAQLATLPGPSGSQVPDAAPSLLVPESRFADDFQRPRIHPMPPAGWTNEPHGLVSFNGAWHMFYQRTPNGPFKTQMHWGHMMSRDLVTWENLPDALWPELQTPEFGFDMKGIWSGDVIVDGGRAFAFYTSVNHGSRLAASNPGIAMAVSTDPQLRDWHKLGPILNTEGVKDFRDPFLWKEGNTWHMIIGAALETGGGLDYLVLNPGEKGGRWERQRRFSELSYRVMDPGSVIWEMPVFEKLSETVWILLVNPIGGKVSKYGNPATRAVYWTGEWSGGVFKPFFRDAKPLDLVPGHLAPTVERAPDGSLRAIGIIDERRTPVSQERAGWANMFGLPRVWTLMPDRRTLGQAPAPELGAMRGEPRIARKGVAIGGAPVTIDDGLRAYELQLDLGTRASQGPITIDVLASPDGRETTRLRFDPTQGSVAVDKSHSTLSDEGEGPQVLNGVYDSRTFGDMRRLRVIVDGSSIEVFINDAAAYAVRSYPSLPGATGLRIAEAGNPGATADLTLWPLRRPVR